MPSIFKKLFGRKSKSEALALVNSGSSGAMANSTATAVLSASKKDKKNKSNRVLSRKQKKQDNKAAFPSLPSKALKSKPLASSDVSAEFSNVNRHYLLDGDVEKENSPVGLSMNGNVVDGVGGSNTATTRNEPSSEDQTMSFTKPTLSLIAEETSPRNEDSNVKESAVDDEAHDAKYKIPLEQGKVLSPMSENKPPLTPNRSGHRNANSSNGHFYYQHLAGVKTEHKNMIPHDSASFSNISMNHPRESNNDDKMFHTFGNNSSIRVSGVSIGTGNNQKRMIGNGRNEVEENFVSTLDRSPFSYASDDDNVLFPALVDEKDPFASQDPLVKLTNPGLNNKSQGHLNSLRINGDIVPMAHETQDDIRAWTPSPTKKGSSSFTFTHGDKMLSPSAVSNARASMFEQNKKSSKSGAGSHHHAHFDNFANFETFDPNQRHFIKNNSPSMMSSSKSGAYNPISPVSALLEGSRAKRMSGRNSDGACAINGSAGNTNHHRNEGSSINSAPIMTSSFVRSQVQRSRQNTSSIARVIDNLELHVNKRQGHNHTGSISSNNVPSVKDLLSEVSSQHSRKSVESSTRDAKGLLQRDELINNESKMIDILANGGGGALAAAVMNKNGDNNWLFDEVTGTLGPRSVAADLESLGGRSNRSGKSKNSIGNKSHRSHRSKKSQHGPRSQKSRNADGDLSVDSRTSRNSRASYRSYQTTKSMVSQMSEQSRSVANDLLRLEAQLSMVGKSRQCSSSSTVGSTLELNKRRDDCGMTVSSRDFSISRSSAGGLPRPKGLNSHISASARRAAAVTLRSKVSVTAPPGKLGIILANRTDSRGTVVSGVRTSSVLASHVSPGDRIIAIDDEDVSQMNVKEITTIMARKSEFERVLVLLAAAKQQYD